MATCLFRTDESRQFNKDSEYKQCHEPFYKNDFFNVKLKTNNDESKRMVTKEC